MYVRVCISILIRAMTVRRMAITGMAVHGPTGNDTMATGRMARMAVETNGGATGSPATRATVSTADDLGGAALRHV